MLPYVYVTAVAHKLAMLMFIRMSRKGGQGFCVHKLIFVLILLGKVSSPSYEVRFDDKYDQSKMIIAYSLQSLH